MQGKGLGSEIVRRLLEWADADLQAQRTVCIIDPENAPSLGVARKCGYREYASTVYHDHATLLLERARPV